MIIEQFEDKELSHYSYAILSESKLVLIDPARDTELYLSFAQRHKAQIVGVIETHPHADFISSHLELQQSTGAKIYCSGLLDSEYPSEPFDEGDSLTFGKIKLKAINTPGHSPDSICVVLELDGRDKAVFTGDTLFIGDCGRPDLREKAGNIPAKREELARQMYHSLRDKLMELDDTVVVYPSHGAGTLCGKSLSEASQSTIGKEKATNWSLKEMSEEAFVKALTEDQPFIPNYFAFDVKLNKKGAIALHDSISAVEIGKAINSAEDTTRLDKKIIIIDTRSSEKFKDQHLPNSINIMAEGKFETWLGSILLPEEPFFLAAENSEVLNELLKRVAKIGYELFIQEAFVLNFGEAKSAKIDLQAFRLQPENYTIVDIRNEKEANDEPIFSSAINIPLPELRERITEIPSEKPIAVHCAGGYRSAAGSSIIEDHISTVAVYDLSKAINDFSK